MNYDLNDPHVARAIAKARNRNYTTKRSAIVAAMMALTLIGRGKRFSMADVLEMAGEISGKSEKLNPNFVGKLKREGVLVGDKQKGYLWVFPPEALDGTEIPVIVDPLDELVYRDIGYEPARRAA